MKEIDSTEKNLLHKLGVLPWESTDPRDPKGRYNSGYLYYFGFWLKLLSIVVAFLMAFTYSGNTRVIFVGVVVLFGIVMFALNRKITTEIDINERGKMIRNFGLMEIASIYLPCILIINGTNWPDITVLLVGAIVYFMLMNRWLWNTWVAPRV